MGAFSRSVEVLATPLSIRATQIYEMYFSFLSGKVSIDSNHLAHIAFNLVTPGHQVKIDATSTGLRLIAGSWGLLTHHQR
jgi:hypothetical protein